MDWFTQLAVGAVIVLAMELRYQCRTASMLEAEAARLRRQVERLEDDLFGPAGCDERDDLFANMN